MASQSDEQKRKMALRSCTLCLRSYREPKILPCFDSFCCACLKGVVSLWVSGKDDLKSIPCPRCKELFPLPDNGVDGLRDNMYLDDCESSPALLDRPITCQLCSERREITMLCYDCNDLYCHDCKRIHDRVNGTRSHAVHTIVQDYYTKNSPQTSRLDEPPVHDKNEYLQIWDNSKVDSEVYDKFEDDNVKDKEDQSVQYESVALIFPTPTYLTLNAVIPNTTRNRRYVNITNPFTERPPLPPRAPPILSGGQDYDGNHCRKSIHKVHDRDDKKLPQGKSFHTIACNDSQLPTPDRKAMRVHPFNGLRETPNADIPYFVDALLDSFGKLQTYVTKFECTSRRNVYSICIANETDIVMVSKANKKAQLNVYQLNGNGKRRDKELASEHVTVASVNDNIFFVAERDWNNVYWTTTDSSQENKLGNVTAKKPVLSKPVSGKSIHIIGKGQEGFFWLVQRIEFARNAFPVTELIVDGNVISFDVSADGEYFAVMSSTQRLYVYFKDQKEPKSAYDCHGGDVCFYTKGGREVLLVADTHHDSIVMLDHTKDCNVLGRTSILRPACMTKDKKGRLWVASNWDSKTATKTRVLLF